MAVIIDDAGSGDLLFGVVIGAYNDKNRDFRYDVINVRYFQPPIFSQKLYLNQASVIVFSLLNRLKIETDEPISICRSYIFDNAVKDLRQKYGVDRIKKIKVTGEPQRFTETAYLDELRNLGYTPIENRDEKRARSFFHMMRWLKRNPEKMKYAKTGWPRLSKYPLFRDN
jgi:hypothetical protein